MVGTVDTLASISGLRREEIQSAWEAARANRKLLDGCKRHRFAGGAWRVGEKHHCLECGGQMVGPDVATYIAGYVAAGRDPNDIWPQYRVPTR